MPELGLLLVTDRLLERHRRLRGATDLVDLLDRELELQRDLLRRRLTAALGAQLALGTHDLVQLLDHMHRHPNRPRLVRQRTRDRLPDPPRRIRRELEPLAIVELLRRPHQPDRPLLDQIQKRQPLIAVTLRNRHHQPQVRLHHLLLRPMVTALDPLRQLHLLRRGQQVDLADVLQEQLQRVRRELDLQRLLLLARVVELGVGHLHGLRLRLQLLHELQLGLLPQEGRPSSFFPCAHSAPPQLPCAM